ncbi:MAG: hypothetical protein Q8O87_04190 [bacterium]|nr:hypothetical protein [bacterium]
MNIITYNGEKRWYKNGKRHREDGPAIEYADGTKSWYINDNSLTEEEFNLQMRSKPIRTEHGNRVEWRLDGERHRDDGPAVEWSNGTKSWYINGKCHREDGPAVEGFAGDKWWYLNGKRLSEEKFNIQMKSKPIRTKHEDRVEWTLDGKLHREDGPAFEGADGTKKWYINDETLTEAQFLTKMVQVQNELNRHEVDSALRFKG